MASTATGQEEKERQTHRPTPQNTLHLDETPTVRKSKANWAQLIQKVYEIDPLQCPKCDHTMRIIAVIDESAVIRRILKHLHKWDPVPDKPDHPARDPPWPKGETIPLTYHPVPDIA